MGLGGPVWHASVGGKFAPKVRRRLALEALRGVGRPELQWEDGRDMAYHIRRRLTEAEQMLVGDVKDLRGTVEAGERLARATLPAAVRAFAFEEIAAP